MLDLQSILAHVTEVGGSDLHVKGSSAPRVRVNGDLRPTPFPPVERTEVEECLRVIMPVDRIEEFHRTGEADFSLSVDGLGRFRGNAFRQRGTAAMVLRRVLPAAMSVLDLGLSSGDFGEITARLCTLVPAGRRLMVLEGGYDLQALTDSTQACVAALAGERVRPEGLTSGGPGRPVVDKVHQVNAFQ